MANAAREAFWARLGDGRRGELRDAPGWEVSLESALDEPRATWNAEWLDREDFAGELAARLHHDDGDVANWWRHLRPADLYLACACGRGVARAIERFEALHGDEIARIARRFERPGLGAEDLVQLLRAKLFTAGAGEAPPWVSGAAARIASYTGRGFLQNWVRVTATRTFIDCCRGQADLREAPLADGLLAILQEPGAHPELELLKREHAAQFKAAFAEGVVGLDSADRVLLKQHLVDHLTIDQIGAVYHVHRATAARRLTRARAALLDGARAALARRLGLSTDRLSGALDLLASRLEASVERLLR